MIYKVKGRILALFLSLLLVGCGQYLVCDEKPHLNSLGVLQEFVSTSSTGESRVLRVVSQKKKCRIEENRPAKGEKGFLVEAIDATRAKRYRIQGFVDDRVEPAVSVGSPAGELIVLQGGRFHKIDTGITNVSTTTDGTKTSVLSSAETSTLFAIDINSYGSNSVSANQSKLDGSRKESVEGKADSYSCWYPYPLASVGWGLPATLKVEIDKALIPDTLIVKLDEGLLKKELVPKEISIKADQTLTEALKSTLSLEAKGDFGIEPKSTIDGRLDAQLAGSATLNATLDGPSAGPLSQQVDILGFPSAERISRPEEPLELANVTYETKSDCKSVALTLKFQGDLGMLGQVELYKAGDVECRDVLKGSELFVAKPVPLRPGRAEKITTIPVDLNELKASVDFKGVTCLWVEGIEVKVAPRTKMRNEKREHSASGNSAGGVLENNVITSEDERPVKKERYRQLIALNPICGD